jgi:hypothetical protein
LEAKTVPSGFTIITQIGPNGVLATKGSDPQLYDGTLVITENGESVLTCHPVREVVSPAPG